MLELWQARQQAPCYMQLLSAGATALGPPASSSPISCWKGVTVLCRKSMACGKAEGCLSAQWGGTVACIPGRSTPGKPTGTSRPGAPTGGWGGVTTRPSAARAKYGQEEKEQKQRNGKRHPRAAHAGTEGKDAEATAVEAAGQRQPSWQVRPQSAH